MGRYCPMTPVDETNTSCRPTPVAAAVASTIAHASFNPRSPVHALAFPLFTTNARKVPEDFSCCLQTNTGAAWTLLVVKSPAAYAGTSEKRRARSFFDFFTPL